MTSEVHAYVFIGRDRWGFTHDETGANLPLADAPWSFFRNAFIPSEPGSVRSETEQAVLTELRRNGFSIQPLTTYHSE